MGLPNKGRIQVVFVIVPIYLIIVHQLLIKPDKLLSRKQTLACIELCDQ